MNPVAKYLLSLSALVLFLAPKAHGTAGDLDTSFNPGSGANAEINATAVQSDGKVIIGGNFTSYNGVAINRIARLNTDGSLDSSFNVGTGANDYVFAIVIQPDGKVIIGGSFTLVNGVISRRIARLNTNGSVDTAFNPSPAFDQTGGADSAIYALALHADGKVTIGGAFGVYRTVTRNRLARLNSNGTLDTAFDPGAGPNFHVYAIAVLSDNRVVIGGLFESYAGVSRNHIARVSATGSLDTSFNPGTGANSAVNAVALQPDGKILIAGTFFSYNSALTGRVARLNTNGSLDPSFSSNFGNGGTVKSMVLQSTGKIVVGGSFTSPIPGVTRLNSDGSSDLYFDGGTGPNDFVESVSLTAGNKIVIGGVFTSYDGVGRGRVARLQGLTAPYLRNISTRMPVLTGERVAIAGFIITGSGSKDVVVRGIGPSLTAAGVPGALQDPVIELRNSSGALINSNDNWKDTQATAIQNSGIAPSDDRESALRITLGTGNYTAILSGKSGTTGNGLIEVYDLTGFSSAKLANISTRGFVGAGDQVMIGGFIMGGDNALVVPRAIGPSLSNAGISGALADPKLAVYNARAELQGFNDDWKGGQQSQLIALGLQPSNDLEAAMVLTLQSGNYTAVVEGVNDGTGVGLIEIYHTQ